jgi:hypothetical protein
LRPPPPSISHELSPTAHLTRQPSPKLLLSLVEGNAAFISYLNVELKENISSLEVLIERQELGLSMLSFIR